MSVMPWKFVSVMHSGIAWCLVLLYWGIRSEFFGSSYDMGWSSFIFVSRVPKFYSVILLFVSSAYERCFKWLREDCMWSIKIIIKKEWPKDISLGNATWVLLNDACWGVVEFTLMMHVISFMWIQVVMTLRLVMCITQSTGRKSRYWSPIYQRILRTGNNMEQERIHLQVLSGF